MKIVREPTTLMLLITIGCRFRHLAQNQYTDQQYNHQFSHLVWHWENVHNFGNLLYSEVWNPVFRTYIYCFCCCTNLDLNRRRNSKASSGQGDFGLHNLLRDAVAFFAVFVSFDLMTLWCLHLWTVYDWMFNKMKKGVLFNRVIQ